MYMVITERPRLTGEDILGSDISSMSYVVLESDGMVQVCLNLSSLYAFSFNVTLEAVEKSPVSAQGW